MKHPYSQRAMVVLAVIVLAVLWQQVFAMTGLLWWNADAPVAKAPRPATPIITPMPTGWVDLQEYLKTHPVWQPG